MLESIEARAETRIDPVDNSTESGRDFLERRQDVVVSHGRDVRVVVSPVTEPGLNPNMRRPDHERNDRIDRTPDHNERRYLPARRQLDLCRQMDMRRNGHIARLCLAERLIGKGVARARKAFDDELGPTRDPARSRRLRAQQQVHRKVRGMIADELACSPKRSARRVSSLPFNLTPRPVRHGALTSSASAGERRSSLQMPITTTMQVKMP